MAGKKIGAEHGDYDLLGKTELTIQPIVLEGANLNDIAAVVAEVLSMGRDEVWVVDVRGQALTVDILRESIDVNAIAGKQEELLRCLGDLKGVEVLEGTSTSSAGMLGWIAYDEGETREALERSERMSAEILERIGRRVVVFSTGAEVASGQIEDTNAPAIAERLGAEGYEVFRGGVLPDDRDTIAGRIRGAILDGGYGTVITTGGVGAEDKDHTVEAVLALDPQAATPYITHYHVGTGRHVKDGVRIAVARYRGALIVCLPGPNDEVRASLDVIADNLNGHARAEALAGDIARRLRQCLREKAGS